MKNRARPLLGTIVAIRADATHAAIDAAFKAIERVHFLMNAHSSAGDIAAINRTACRRPVPVHAWTFRVLAAALRISRASAGAFDPTLGRGATHEDIVLLPGRRVRLRRRARLDLGGIAKGFAVDRAVEALRRHGARAGCVNAGGDLRLFGRAPQVVRVRLPSEPSASVVLATARERAFATSAAYFGGMHIDARRGRRLRLQSSITVSAPSCMVADALTKAVAAAGPMPDLLARFRAQAYLVDGQGAIHAPRR